MALSVKLHLDCTQNSENVSHDNLHAHKIKPEILKLFKPNILFTQKPVFLYMWKMGFVLVKNILSFPLKTR